MPGIPPGLLVLLLGNSVITKYNAIAAATWLVWDFFISIEDEVELIWKSRNSLPKYLYFFSRYFGMFMQVFLAAGAQPLYCKEWLVFEAMCDLLSILLFGRSNAESDADLYSTFALTVTAVEISMILRIQALYGGSRTVLVLLLSVLAVEILCFSIITVIGYRAATPSLRPFPEQWPIKGCIMTKIPKIFELCWLPTLICESLLFSLTAYKCLASGPRFRSGFHTPTHVKFFRDGIVYYALTFGKHATWWS
ncbi:hypothetical protein GLOTRDRAFT_131904 [Gloeophyllum trabeum ATCC 11539]|uniref:DUF6533 domain-containing protein n=1 Tax=Gloeophyllum trabeum (strain ATCC 11539 / FP-39264 / Madison 617) TaxID=670483 RepID=S7PYX5_GLOTA|nr:uncharacterized protein GLOTRDRAFT_131904 [Gloeophyllum trabeum ATCC 11539]EPQ52668.1 hypothetical protein GLOTRDRAFT_131904 [Gloeophyllum trabeum ATCC 11539]